MIIAVKLVAQELDPAYHNNEEILAELTAYAEEYPEWMTLDSIGHSAEFGRPIWMAKISDNPDQIEPEAAILLVGQVHAEEVVGVEIVLEIMRQMLDHNEQNPFRQRLEGLEIYLIPTANPEGLEIVHSGVDVTFRKNCRNNLDDGELRIFDGAGWDTSGVDLNRNFGTHWDRGDTLFFPEENYCFNAFRGSAPFSEPESRALRDLAEQRPFLYSIVYHGSRSGNSAEMLIAPWFWRENGIIKRPPDAPAINGLGEVLAGLMPKQNDPNQNYRPVQSMQRKGQLQDWYYVATGCIQYMAEVGAEVQPDEAGMRQIVADNLPSVWYLMDLALGLERLNGFGTLTVIAEDAATSEPLDATIVVETLDHPILAPRRTNPLNGRFDWLLEAEAHNITIKKQGYESQSFENFRIGDGERMVLEIELEPLPVFVADFGLNVIIEGDASEAWLSVYDLDGDLIFDQAQNRLLQEIPLTAGEFTSLELWAGDFKYLVTSPGHLTVTGQFHHQGEEVVANFNLPRVETAYAEDFDFDDDWLREGDGWGLTTFEDRTCLTESVTGDYPTNADLWLQLSDIVRLDTTQAMMRIIHRPYCEPEDDHQEISWWTNPDEVYTKRYTQLRQDWDTLYVPLDSLDRGLLSVRFNVISDEAIGEDGWLIDRVEIFHTGPAHEVAPGSGASDLQPLLFKICPAYPNPFNSTTTINYTITTTSGINLSIYNTQGQLVETLLDRMMPAGRHSVVWEADQVPAGVYLVRMQDEGGGMNGMQKVVLMR